VVTSVKAAGNLNKYYKDFGQTENAYLYFVIQLNIIILYHNITVFVNTDTYLCRFCHGVSESFILKICGKVLFRWKNNINYYEHRFRLIYNKHKKCDVTLFEKILQCSGNVFFFSRNCDVLAGRNITKVFLCFLMLPV